MSLEERRDEVAGVAEGDVLVLDEPLSFWGGVHEESGIISDIHHAQHGASLVNRIVLSVLFGSFVVGLGLIIVAYQPTQHDRFIRWLVGIGFALVVLLGIWLARDILRSRRR